MYILFDVGGTNLRIATSTNLKKLDNFKIVKTPKNYNQALEIFREHADEKVKGVAGGLPCTFKNSKKQIAICPNLPKWNNKNIYNDLSKIFKTKNIKLENDAALAGLGEAVHGAGKKYKIISYLTLSTGIGGAKIVDKKLVENYLGYEPGFQIIDFKNKQQLIAGSDLNKIKKPDWEDINNRLAAGIYNSIIFWSPEVVVLGGGMLKNEN
ncbi:MAG: ROK family protein, partial [Patescibacteria group bacterium]